MNFLSLVGVELKKIRRSKILLILLIPVIMMWIPSIINADMNFDLRGIPITPENNFFIQGFMGMVWFMIPASLVICTVLTFLVFAVFYVIVYLITAREYYKIVSE